MKAYVLAETGPELRDIETPRPKPHEVLVRVRAAALNRVDLAMARGHVHGGAGGQGAVLGLEWAGEVAEVGAEARGVSVGQRVMGSGAGAFADYAVADASISTAVSAVAAIYPPVLMYRGDTRPSGGTNARALPGCDVSDEECELASPIAYVSADFPPAMLLHGDVDKVVPVSASRRFDEALRAAGGHVDLHIFTGLPHGFANTPRIRPMLMTMISTFFQRTVADPQAFVMEPAAPAREPAPAWQG